RVERDGHGRRRVPPPQAVAAVQVDDAIPRGPARATPGPATRPSAGCFTTPAATRTSSTQSGTSGLGIRYGSGAEVSKGRRAGCQALGDFRTVRVEESCRSVALQPEGSP